MKKTLLLLPALIALPAFADTESDMKRIFDDFNFMSYQLTLDTKAQNFGAQVAAPQAGTAPRRSTSHKTTSQPQPAQQEVKPVTRAFSAKTIWSDINVTCLDYGTHLVLQVTTSKPAQGWMLQQGSSNNIIYRGNVEGNAVSFQIQIPRQYSPDLGLTVIVTNDDSQNPAFIGLK